MSAHRASESEVQRQQRLKAGQLVSQRPNITIVCYLANGENLFEEILNQIANINTGLLAIENVRLYIGSAQSEETNHRTEANRMSARLRRITARQTNQDHHRAAIGQFKKSIFVGPFNPCYCCS